MFVLVTSGLAYGQFHDNGYKDLALHASYAKTGKILNVEPKLKSLGSFGLHEAKVKYDGLDLELTFSELPSGEKELTGISTSSPGAKLKGISQPLIGKDYKTVKSVLGSKLSSLEDGNFKSVQLYFSSTGNADENDGETAVLLDFDEKGLLSSISVAELGG